MRQGNSKLFYSNFGKGVQLVFGAITALLAAFIFIGSTGDVSPAMSVSHGDKFMHLGAYFALTVFALPAFPHVKPTFIWYVVSLYGIFIELAQGLFFENRTADILDGIANSTGALLAVIAWLTLSRISSPLSLQTRN